MSVHLLRSISNFRAAVLLRSLSALALTLAAPAKSPAQGVAPDDEVVRLARFQISGEREHDYASVLSSGGTKTSTPLAETPQAISVVTRFQIEDQAAQTLQEVLRYAPGVRAETFGVDNRGDYFLLRGGSEGSTVLDGLRLPLTGSWGSVRNEPYAFERVEVLRGPSSVMFGQNGPGGLVNLISKFPQAKARRELQIQSGTRDHRLVALDLTGPIHETGLSYRLVGLAKDAGTQVDHAYEKRDYVAPSLRWSPTQATAVTFYAQYQKDESDNTNAFLPFTGTIEPAPFGPASSALFIGEPAWDTYGGERVRFGYQVEHQVNPEWSFRHQFRYDDVDGHLLTMYANFWEGLLPDQRSINRTWYAAEYAHRIVNTEVLVEGKLNFGQMEHTVMVGPDAYWSRHDDVGDGGVATPLDLYAPVYGTFARPPLSYGPVNRTHNRQLGVMLQDQIKIAEKWVAVGSLRHDQAKGEVRGDLLAGNDDGAVSNRVGVVYLAPGGWSPYLSYSQSFEAVAGQDAVGASFKPKRGEQVEIGLKWEPKEGRVAAAMSAYDLVEKNRLTPDPLDPVGHSVQKGEVAVQGIEIETTANIGPVSVIANYTYTDVETNASSDPTDSELHHRLNSVPEHSAALWAVHSFATRPLRGLRLGAGVRYVGETWDGTDTIRTASNTLFDGLVSYDRGRWHYAGNASNVFDRHYFATSLTRGDTWFGSRRKIIATVGYRW